MLRLILALQSVGAVEAIPPTFDLKNQPPADVSSIVVTARRTQGQRIDRTPVSNEPPLGRAEMGLFGKAKANIHTQSKDMGNGTTSSRVMVGMKIPF